MWSSKLPKLTLSLWQQSLHNKVETPTWQELNAVLTERHRTLEGCDLFKKEIHPVRTCARFLQMTVDERSAYIKRKQLCLNCFARGHHLRDCKGTHSCFTCRGRHHTLLHRVNSSPSPSHTSPDQDQIHQLPPLPGPGTLQS